MLLETASPPNNDESMLAGASWTAVPNVYTDPMFVQLMNTLRNMFGKDLAAAVEPLARATARKLTPSQQAIRTTLTPGERRRLKCPKTSICRAGGKSTLNFVGPPT